jgi:hypothetical protein
MRLPTSKIGGVVIGVIGSQPAARRSRRTKDGWGDGDLATPRRADEGSHRGGQVTRTGDGKAYRTIAAVRRAIVTGFSRPADAVWTFGWGQRAGVFTRNAAPLSASGTAGHVPRAVTIRRAAERTWMAGTRAVVATEPLRGAGQTIDGGRATAAVRADLCASGSLAGVILRATTIVGARNHRPLGLASPIDAGLALEALIKDVAVSGSVRGRGCPRHAVAIDAIRSWAAIIVKETAGRERGNASQPYKRKGQQNLFHGPAGLSEPAGNSVPSPWPAVPGPQATASTMFVLGPKTSATLPDPVLKKSWLDQ